MDKQNDNARVMVRHEGSIVIDCEERFIEGVGAEGQTIRVDFGHPRKQTKADLFILWQAVAVAQAHFTSQPEGTMWSGATFDKLFQLVASDFGWDLSSTSIIEYWNAARGRKRGPRRQVKQIVVNGVKLTSDKRHQAAAAIFQREAEAYWYGDRRTCSEKRQYCKVVLRNPNPTTDRLKALIAKGSAGMQLQRGHVALRWLQEHRPQSATFVISQISNALFMTAQNEEAIQHSWLAAQHCLKTGHPESAVEHLIGCSVAIRPLGEIDRLIRTLDEICKICYLHPNLPSRFAPAILREIGIVEYDSGDRKNARDTLELGMNWCDRVGLPQTDPTRLAIARRLAHISGEDSKKEMDCRISELRDLVAQAKGSGGPVFAGNTALSIVCLAAEHTMTDRVLKFIEEFKSTLLEGSPWTNVAADSLEAWAREKAGDTAEALRLADTANRTIQEHRFVAPIISTIEGDPLFRPDLVLRSLGHPARVLAERGRQPFERHQLKFLKSVAEKLIEG